MALYIELISFSVMTEKSTTGSWFDFIHSPILLNFFFTSLVSIFVLLFFYHCKFTTYFRNLQTIRGIFEKKSAEHSALFLKLHFAGIELEHLETALAVCHIDVTVGNGDIVGRLLHRLACHHLVVIGVLVEYHQAV